MSLSPRQAAALAVARVIRGGESLADALPAVIAAVAAGDRALAAELAYGTLRYLPRLEFLLTQLMTRPVRRREPEVHALLLVGLYQLGYTRVPAHAAVSETVTAARALDKAWAAGLTNAVLRRYQRERDALEARLDAHPVARFAHPAWLIEAVRRDWPDDWEAVLAANNARAPLTLRVNAARTTREAYCARLAAAGLAAEPHPYARDAVTLADAVDVEHLPGFAQGEVSVQDAAAQLAADLVDPRPGERLLDACAAPGGKTGHLLERAGDAELVALDADSGRLARIAENLARLGLAARLVVGDARKPRDWWDGRPFDRILLDAPCSASGVIRRHPDIKTLRRATDLPKLAGQQAAMLDALWPLLQPGGKLVYATCSIFEAENAAQIARFVARHADAVAVPLAVPWGRVRGFGRQILPGEAGMDGFFYACLVKRPA